MRTRVFLSPENNALVGAFPSESEHIHIVCDSANAAFTVQLPDVKQPENREFIFYNLPSSGAGHTVSIVPVSGQKLIVNDTAHSLSPFDTVSAVADLRNTWLLTDINRGSSILFDTLPVYDDNASAIAGGLVAGQPYRRGTDPDAILVVT
jgi:hypothetical protein